MPKSRAGDSDRESEGEQGSPHIHVTERSKTKERLLEVRNRLEALEEMELSACTEAAEVRLDVAEGEIKDLQVLYGHEQQEQVRLEDELKKALWEIEFVKSCVSQTGITKGARVTPPDKYEGDQDDNIMENFFFDMGRYLKSMRGLMDEEKVEIATGFLTRAEKLWWRTRLQDMEAGRPIVKVDTWDELQDALKEQFKPENVGWTSFK